MTTMKIKKSCVENKQSVTASGSSLSEENYGFSRMSPAASYPATSSPSHRRTSGPIRRAKGGWTPEEDETLRRAVELHKGRSWKKIAESIPDRTEVQCLHRWQKVINPELVKGSWTPLEDGVIINLVAKYGPTKWSVIAKSLPGRIGKQCRERWHNHLNPEIRKDSWTLEEEIELMKAHIKHGNKWAEIAKVIHGRTDNSIKNHWNSSLRKKLDCYLRTGKLPPVQGTGMFNTAQDAGSLGARQLIYCLNGGLETDVKNVPETARNVSSSLRAKVADKHDGVNPLTASVSDSHHLRPGKLAPVQRAGILNTTQDTENYGARQLIHCSNGGLETKVENVPDTACTVSSSLPVESSKVADQHDSVNPLNASVSEFHYLKASRFPPVQTTCVLNTAQYTRNLGNEKLIFCTNTGFETNVKNFPETAFTISSGLSIDSSKVADQHDSVNPWIASVSDSHSSRDVVVGEADSSVSGECECDAQVPEIVPVYEKDASDSGLKYCKSIGKISQNEEPSETTLCSVPSNISFLCYKPPRLEDLVISGPLSSIAHLTPFINCKCSSEQSIESFLKDAARSFPNTPSIIKRKEAYTSLPCDTDTDTMKSNEIRVHDGCTPNDGNVCSYTEAFRLSASKFYSVDFASNRALFSNEDDFNVSPPYRIWCKRKATFRSVEKQLDFTLAEGYSDGNAKDSSLAGNRSSLSPNSTTVQALSMQRRRLVENPSGGNERDFSSITKMGVV